MPAECHICDKTETLDTCIQYQLAGAPVRIPLCRFHLIACEGALKEIAKYQTPPVVVNVSGVRGGGAGGNG